MTCRFTALEPQEACCHEHCEQPCLESSTNTPKLLTLVEFGQAPKHVKHLTALCPSKVFKHFGGEVVEALLLGCFWSLRVADGSEGVLRLSHSGRGHCGCGVLGHGGFVGFLLCSIHMSQTRAESPLNPKP